MHPSERGGFLADASSIAIGDFVIETYEFECAGDPEEAACALCAEHSTALWRRPGTDEDFRPRHGAKLLRLDVLGASETPVFSNPFVRSKRYSRCRARIANPHVNFGARLPNLLTACAGEGAFYSPGISWIRLADLELPEPFLARFEGPKFGSAGLRGLAGAADRPLLLGVVKPNVGLPPEAFGELAYESWLGGLDMPKDDEMLADAEYSPLAERTKILGRLRRRAEAETGRPLAYLANVTDEVDRMIPLHDVAVANGANALMVNGLCTGLSAVRMLAKHSRVPLVGHFDGLAVLSRVPFFGAAPAVWTRLQRLAGFDGIVMPGFGGRMQASDEEVLASVRACLEPWGPIRPCLPIPGGSDWAGTLAPTAAKLGTLEFGFVPGRGVFGHPDGPRAGARSLVAAWEALRDGVALADKARTDPALARAIEAFGRAKE